MSAISPGATALYEFPMPPQTPGEWVKAVRERAGLSQDEFAARVGVNRVTVANWEREAYVPELESLQKIAKAFPGSQQPPGLEATEPPKSAAEAGAVPATLEAREVAWMIDQQPSEETRRYIRDMVYRIIGSIVPPKPK